MNLKRFGIIASIIIVLIIATTIVLGCVKVNNGLDLDQPSKIVIYNKSSVGVEYTSETTPSKYNKVKEMYEEMTSLSVFDYMLNGISLNQQASQDLSQDYATWKESNKSNNYCLELIFSEKQSVVVSINGNTKVVEFYALIMTIEESSHGKETALYFSTSSGTSKSYSTSPILVTAKQSKLYDYISNL